MTFPLSSAVNVGDATEAAQYNNLRTDALYLGNDPAGSGNLLQLLYHSMGTISLTRVSGTTIRLNASETDPCALMIGGRICSVSTDKTVLLSGTVLRAAGRYYVFAVAQSNGSFELAAGSEAPADGRMIGTFLWDGTGIIPGSLHDRSEFDAIRAVVKPSIANGRLTLASGIPVTDSDVLTADTLYFTPYQGNEIALYAGGEWEVFSFSELSLPLSGLTRLLPYDIFLSADASGLSLTAAAWGSVLARLTSLVSFDGVKVSAADYGKRYLGSIVLNADGSGEDSVTGRLVWNENNRVERSLIAKITTSVTVGAAQNKWMPYYLEYTPEVRLLVPDPDTTFELTGTGISGFISENDALYERCAIVGIGQDMNFDTFDENTSCVPVYTESYGNTPMNVNIRNYGPSFRGYHRYALAFYTNYAFRPMGVRFSSMGAGPGLYGMIMG